MYKTVDGKVAQYAAVQFLKRSNLPQNVIADVWKVGNFYYFYCIILEELLHKVSSWNNKNMLDNIVYGKYFFIF